MLSVKQVDERVAEIRHAAEVERDDEKAHGCEDQLYRLVLGEIQVGHPTPALLAEAALKADRINFMRHCA